MDFKLLLPYIYQSVGYILILLLIAILVTINKVSQDKLADFIKNIYKKIRGKEKNVIHIDEEILYVFEAISSDLTALKTKLNADRASIFEFHNGDYFISKNSRYKMSCTYEKTSPGVSSEASKLQNIDISLHWDDFLKPLFIKNIEHLPEGFEHLHNSLSSCSLETCIISSGLYFVDVSKMLEQDRITKSLLLKQGSNYLIMQSIKNSKGVIYGYVVFDFMDEKPDLTNIKTCEICKFTKQIALLWESNEAMKNNALKYKKQIYQK